jgi:hypothetical protein
MMRVVYLPANGCYAVLFGDSLTSVDGQCLFRSLKDLEWVLKRLGLKLKGNRIVCA